MELEVIKSLIACISLIIGAVECFAGFKIMKATLVIWGFIIGAALGVVIGVSSEFVSLGVISVIVLGIVLAILSYKLYLAGIFMITVFLTTAAVYIIDENILVSLLIAVFVGVLAIFFVKPVVIISTAFSGAGIIVSSAYLMMKLGMNPNPAITAIMWIPIALAGTLCQYVTTLKPKSDKRKNVSGYGDSAMTFSERKYPGMQRAYRNFCIKCGCEMQGSNTKCPRCGFSFDD